MADMAAVSSRLRGTAVQVKPLHEGHEGHEDTHEEAIGKTSQPEGSSKTLLVTRLRGPRVLRVKAFPETLTNSADLFRPARTRAEYSCRRGMPRPLSTGSPC